MDGRIKNVTSSRKLPVMCKRKLVTCHQVTNIGSYHENENSFVNGALGDAREAAMIRAPAVANQRPDQPPSILVYKASEHTGEIGQPGNICSTLRAGTLHCVLDVFLSPWRASQALSNAIILRKMPGSRTS